MVSLAFVWDLFGGLLGAPKWLLDVTPFEHIGLVPAQPFKATAAIVMLVIAAAAGLSAVALFARRDVGGN
jgi:ABC-2 type transport system permease protein